MGPTVDPDVQRGQLRDSRCLQNGPRTGKRESIGDAAANQGTDGGRKGDLQGVYQGFGSPTLVGSLDMPRA